VKPLISGDGAHARRTVSTTDADLGAQPKELDMGNKNKGGREAKKSKKSAKAKAPVASTILPPPPRQPAEPPK
jgi:hypothetical protein